MKSPTALLPAAFVVAGLAASLAGCGQTGPLYMPKPPAKPATQTPAPATPLKPATAAAAAPNPEPASVPVQ